MTKTWTLSLLYSRQQALPSSHDCLRAHTRTKSQPIALKRPPPACLVPTPCRDQIPTVKRRSKRRKWRPSRSWRIRKRAIRGSLKPTTSMMNTLNAVGASSRPRCGQPTSPPRSCPSGSSILLSPERMRLRSARSCGSSARWRASRSARSSRTPTSLPWPRERSPSPTVRRPLGLAPWHSRGSRSVLGVNPSATDLATPNPL